MLLKESDALCPFFNMKSPLYFPFCACLILSSFAGERAIDIGLGNSGLKDDSDRVSRESIEKLAEREVSLFTGQEQGAFKSIKKSKQPTSKWVVGVGSSGVLTGAIRFRTGASQFVIPNVFGENSFTIPPEIGPVEGILFRNYDDGYVRPDTRAATTGRTTDYGYENQEQLVGEFLVMSASNGERRIVERDEFSAPTGWGEKNNWASSFSLNFSQLNQAKSGVQVGPIISLNYTNLKRSRGNLNTLSASELRTISNVRVTDFFDANGLVLPLPPYIGSPGAVAPLLPIEPSERFFEDSFLSSDSAFFSDHVSESLGVNLLSFFVGANAIYTKGDRFFVGGNTGLVINIVDWEAIRRDELFQSVNGGLPSLIGSDYSRSSVSELLLGCRVQVTGGIQLNESWSIDAHARYDWNEPLKGSVGKSQFNADLSGLMIGIGANYTF